MTKKYNVVIEKDLEGNLIASVPSIQGAYTEAKDISTLLKNITEVITCWKEIEKENIIPLEFIGVQAIEI
jgi:predicted RNase H-like HicB family nuclease